MVLSEVSLRTDVFILTEQAFFTWTDPVPPACLHRHCPFTTCTGGGAGVRMLAAPA